MNKEKRRVPKLRFPGFTEDWEQRKLDDIARIKTGGGTPKTANLEYWSGNIPWIQSSDLVEGDIVHVNINKFINNNALKNSAAKLISRDSITLVTRVGVGKVAVINQDFTTSQDFLSLSDFDGNNIKFLAYQLYRLMQENAKVLQGTSIKGITKTELIEQSISIPSSNQEQNLIANVLSKIDSIITLHQRKLEHLNLKKKALLQKLFPKNGECYPELRFPGFTDAWEQCKLGCLASVEMNKRIFKEQTTTNGDIPFYKIGTFGSDADSFISRELFEEYKNKYPYPNIGDILISASGSIGRTVVYNGEDAYFQDSNIVWLNHNGKIDNSFLLQFYNQVKWAGLEGSTIKRLYNKNILETNIALPKIEEQRLIGKFFTLVDCTITLHQRKLDHLQLQKKALLQQMFV